MRLLRHLATWAIVVFLAAPIVLLILFSFAAGELTAFPIDALTLNWWRAMVADPGFEDAFFMSLRIGLTVALLSVCIGTTGALGLSRLRPRRARLAITILSVPVMLPPLVLGIALLSFYVATGVTLGATTVIASHTLFTLPFVLILLYSRLENFDYAMIEAARDLGASPARAFWDITFPILLPSIISAALLSMALSLDDFVITFFTIGSGNTLPTFVWGMIRTSFTPLANAIGTTIIGLSLILGLLAMTATRRLYHSL